MSDLDLIKLNHLREISDSQDMSVLRETAEKYGAQLTDDIDNADLYHLIMASRANGKNFDVIFSNLQKVL